MNPPQYDPELQESLRLFKAEIFQALAHPTRIAMVELLRQGELVSGAFTEALGIEPANASQHLAVLRDKRVVKKRKEGNQVHYSLRDPSLIEILDLLRGYFERDLRESYAMLREIVTEGQPR
ncbi:MAG TPA: metalloregulator ArsR/SmtB family transcription factor [Fimbriimonadaceae bacterium]|nr:metalloregulator ArsR/SmtB family transcription factor [Fimbriimonadaceae bacterium]